MVKQSVEIYNKERPYMALQYKTPDEVHRAFLIAQDRNGSCFV